MSRIGGNPGSIEARVADAIEAGTDIGILRSQLASGMAPQDATASLAAGLSLWHEGNRRRYLVDALVALVCVIGGSALLISIGIAAQQEANESGHGVLVRVPLGTLPFVYAFYRVRAMYRRRQRESDVEVILWSLAPHKNADSVDASVVGRLGLARATFKRLILGSYVDHQELREVLADAKRRKHERAERDTKPPLF